MKSEFTIDNLVNISVLILAITFVPLGLAVSSPVFVKNVGQWPDSILFVCDKGSTALWFTEYGVNYLQSRTIKNDAVGKRIRKVQSLKNSINVTKFDLDLGRFEYQTISAKIANPNRQSSLIGNGQQLHYLNFFNGDDPSKWKSHVPVFDSIRFENIYDGIDLIYYVKGMEIEYDFIVSPGADPSQIAIEYEGAKTVRIDKAGNLVLETEWGEIVESKPIVYQVTDSNIQFVESSFDLIALNRVGIKIHDKFDSSSPLIIDPVLTYSTYFGGGMNEYSLGIDLDSEGNILISGITARLFPTFKALDSTYNGSIDVFITKISESGQELLFSTYLGGTYNDWGFDIKVDDSDNIFVAGLTESSNFPIIRGYDSLFSHGKKDGFLVKLTPECDSIIYSTYIGGSELDWVNGLDVDKSGYAYVAGVTNSPDLYFLTAYNRQFTGILDAFLIKVSPDGLAPVFGTYLGSSSGDAAFDVVVDNKGNAFLCGSAGASDFPITNSEYLGYQGDYSDVFVAQISTKDSDLVYSIRIGGGGEDEGLDIDLDSYGNACVAGRAFGWGFPMINAFDSSYNLGGDLFAAKFEFGTGKPLFSTYLGGRSWEDCYATVVDKDNRMWIAGSTWSDNYPTSNAYDESFGGEMDIFLSCLSSTGNDLLFSTYLGGIEDDDAYALATDSKMNIYITGRSNSPDFPTVNPLQSRNVATDAIIAIFGDVATSVEDSEDSTFPVTYILNNNYPNPFNPSTTITYYLPKKVHVQVTIYNILGEKVKLLVNEIQSAGNYLITWNGTDDRNHNLSTGVYFYELIAAQHREAKKMLLVK